MVFLGGFDGIDLGLSVHSLTLFYDLLLVVEFGLDLILN